MQILILQVLESVINMYFIKINYIQNVSTATSQKATAG